jgi:hypothetical protein
VFFADTSNDDERTLQSPDGAGDETGQFSKTVVWSLFPLLVCASLSLGWWVPLFYDWSGANQSYEPPIVKYVFLGFLIVFAAAVLALPLLPRLNRVEPVRNPLVHLFGVRVGLILLAIAAAGCFFYRDATVMTLGMAMFFYPILCAIKLAIVSASLRWRIASLYSCLYLPFVWIFRDHIFQDSLKRGSLEFVPLMAGAPALLCSVYIGRIVGHHSAPAVASGIFIAGLEALIGLWIIQLGARRAVGYQLVLLAVTVLMSFGLHALMRA